MFSVIAFFNRWFDDFLFNIVIDHFREVTKMVQLGSGSKMKIKDYMLTRYASYLIAQNGDPK